MSRLVRLTEIKEVIRRWPSNTKKYELGEIILNSNSVITMRDGDFFKKEIKTYKGWPVGLDDRISITEISLNNKDMSAVYIIGDLESIMKKVGG